MMASHLSKFLRLFGATNQLKLSFKVLCFHLLSYGLKTRNPCQEEYLNAVCGA